MSLLVKNDCFLVDQKRLELTLSLAPGETKGIYGASGSGKSTLFHLLAGLNEKGFDGGTYTIDGQTMNQLSIRERSTTVSLLFQNPDMQFCMATPREELLFCLENQCIPQKDMPNKVADALAFCEITHLADQPFTTLSGGEKQLAALACCLILESQYLLLDEPFANLDADTSKKVIRKLQHIQQKKAIGILLIDHQIKETANWVDEWLLIEEGFRTIDQAAIRDLDQHMRKTLPLAKIKSSSNKKRLSFQQFRLPIRNHEIVFPNFAFDGGTLIGITGRSGSGKSSFLKAILQQHAYKGDILLAGQPIKKYPSPFRSISWIMQNPQDQFLAATVAQELSQGSAPTESEKLLAKLRLQNKSTQSPFRLSQGQQRRLAVASLLQRPVDLLLVDEPTYGQDIKQAWQIMQLLAEKATTGTLVLIVSHDILLLQQFCSQIIDFNLYEKEDADAHAKSNSQIIRHFRARLTGFFSK
ncbi:MULTISPECIES: ABC transporter ATP-binding protein [unclassified Enterococcus]|uniref:ABC transporter ATP-binding protein n=1 Tax=unclassified Enterococcus TaxID=2608891 RepID=UPI001907F5FD|nr:MULTISPECIES: ABC transporter ATP-binding protein [unclassified Enterococcus]MBK0036630.1 ABC transporter ATP-binding protein [Enterococcus sp. S52]MBK0069293.1 ABC transporter ATP-binding protein [Enterococcus sp. S53]MBK0139886.1 ABC transporter ATP-binding protein [Enterococcus sp. S76]MBK0143655.1 ABC transporter ATP-binding protein [Enterococcus sp. S77]